jgi:hypothetical protein
VNPAKLRVLIAAGTAYKALEKTMRAVREQRDRIALELLDEGYTYRQVAYAAGFKNPYLTQLKRRRGVRWSGKSE